MFISNEVTSTIQKIQEIQKIHKKKNEIIEDSDMLTIKNILDKEVIFIINKISIQHLDQEVNSNLNELSDVLNGEKENIFRSRNLNHIFEKLKKANKARNKKLLCISLERCKFYLGKIFYHSNKKIINLATLKVFNRNLASIEDSQIDLTDYNSKSLNNILKVCNFYDFKNENQINKVLSLASGLQIKMFLGKCSLRFTGIPHDILVLKNMNHSMIIAQIEYQISNIKNHWINIKKAILSLEKFLYKENFTIEMLKRLNKLKKKSNLNKKFKEKISRLFSMMKNLHVSSDTTFTSFSTSWSLNFIPIFVYYTNNLLKNIAKFQEFQPKSKKISNPKEIDKGTSPMFDFSYETNRKLKNFVEEFHQEITSHVSFKAMNFEINILTSPKENSNDSLSIIIDEFGLKINKTIELNISFFRLEKTIEINKEKQNFLKTFNHNVIESFTKKKQGTDLFKTELLEIPNIRIDLSLLWDENFSNYKISQIIPLLQQNINLHLNLLSIISTNPKNKNAFFRNKLNSNECMSQIITFETKKASRNFDFDCDKMLSKLKDYSNSPVFDKEEGSEKKTFKKFFNHNLQILEDQLGIFRTKIEKLNNIVGIKNKKFKVLIGIKISGNQVVKKNPILIIKVDIFNYLLKFNYPKIEFLVKNKICVLNLKKVNKVTYLIKETEI